MRILVVNPNRIKTCTEMIREVAGGAISSGTEIDVVTPRWGPRELPGQVEFALSAVGVIDRVSTYTEPYDAIVMAGFGEPGREPLQELVSVPVLDITECAPVMAMLLGRTYGVVTTFDRFGGVIHDRLRSFGVDSRCSGIRGTGLGVPELMGDVPGSLDRLEEVGRRSLTEDRAEVIVLGCAGMSSYAAPLTERLGVPVVDGIRAGMRLAESLVALSLGASKIGTYADVSPRPTWTLEPDEGPAS